VTKKQTKALEVQEQIAFLLGSSEKYSTPILEQGSTVYSILRYRYPGSSIGYISFLTFRHERQGIDFPTVEQVSILYLNYAMSVILDIPQKEKKGYFCLPILASGMDAAYHTVEKLSYKLFQEGNKLKSQWL